MKSVGEAMAIGRTFKESIQKALRSLEIGRPRIRRRRQARRRRTRPTTRSSRTSSGPPTPSGSSTSGYAFKAGYSVDHIFDLTKIDPWFLHQLREIHEMEEALCGKTPRARSSAGLLRRAKQFGFSDVQLGHLLGSEPRRGPADRETLGIKTTYRLVDTCAAEFEAFTPYYYSSYGDENEVLPSKKRKIMILGGGPNRIGQGIEFDYCCVHASFALQGARIRDGHGQLQSRRPCRPTTTRATGSTSSR